MGKKPDDVIWWKRKGLDVGKIEFTFDVVAVNGDCLHGAVRARLDDLSPWEYFPCCSINYAEILATDIIERQKSKRVGIIC